MPNEPRLQSRDLLFSAQEPTQRTLQEASPRSITISAMTTTTLTSTQLTAALHNGCIVAAEDGVLRGVPNRIKDVTANVATLERAFHTTQAAGSVFRVWIPAAVPVVSDSGSTTTLVDATHANLTNEPDDWCKGDFLLIKNGANAGGAYKISGFATVTGTFSVVGDPFGTTVGAGILADVVTLARPEPGTLSSTVDVNVIERRLQGTGDADLGVVTVSAGSIEAAFPLKPVPTSAPSTVVAVPPYEMGRYLRDFMTQRLDTGTTYTSQTGVAGAINATVAAGAGLTVGGFALFSNGEASQITDKPSANVIVVPQLTTAALVATSNVFASASFIRKESDFRTREWFQYVGGLDLRMFIGTAPTVDLDLARDAVIKWMLKYSAMDALELPGIGNPNGLASHKFALSADTTVPVDGKGARILIDTVPLLVGAVKINFGIKTIARNSISGMNQGDGYAFDCEPVTWSVSGILADNNDIASNQKISDRLRRGDTFSLFYQKGTNPTETFCAAAPALMITKLSGKHNGGQFEFDLEGKCVAPQLSRGSTANAALPAFAIGWL